MGVGTAPAVAGIERGTVLNLLRYMHLARKFEEAVQHYFSLGMIHGTTHLGIGEEATGAGTCLALEARAHYPGQLSVCSHCLQCFATA